ncbi:MAG: MG2 domain-containing protein, partial [Spirochaetota bacterium]
VPWQITREPIKNRGFEFRNTKAFTPSRDVDIRIYRGNKALKFSGITTQKDTESSFKVTGELSLRDRDCDFKHFQSRWYCSFIFSNPVLGSEALEHLTIEPAAPLAVKTPQGYIKKFRLNHWLLESGKTYTFTFRAGMRDIYSNGLKETQKYVIKMPKYKPDFDIASSNSVIESRMQQKLSLDIANIPKLNVEITNVDIATLLRKKQAKYPWKVKYFDKNPSVRKVIWNTGSSPYRGARFGFDLAPYLNSKQQGWLAVRFAGKQTQFVQSTNLGILVKDTEKEANVWVHSLSDTKNQNYVRITSYTGGKKRASCLTNSQGFCSLQAGSLYIAEKKQDKAFVDSGKYALYMHGLLRSGYYTRYGSRKTKEGKFFYDRKLYRPGDTMHWKGVIGTRKNNTFLPLASKKVQVEISNAKGDLVLEETLETSANGGVWGELGLPVETSLGKYSISVEHKGSTFAIGNFLVEEFRPVNFSVGLGGLKDAIIGKKHDIFISGTYLFGAPMSEAKVNYTLKRYHREIFLEQYRGFRFGDALEGTEEGSKDYSHTGMFSQKESKLGFDGKKKVKVDLKPMLTIEKIHKPFYKEYKMSRSYKVEVEAKVTDKDSKSVSKSENMLAAAGSFVPAIKTDDSYHYYKRPFRFHLIAVDPSGKSKAAKYAKVRILRRVWKKIRTKSGLYTGQFKNTLTNELIQEKRIQLSANARKYNFRARKAGKYTITVQIEGELSFARQKFHAWGEDYYGWRGRDDNSVAVETDRNSYKPGETAKVLVQSPFKKCKAIITLERDTILWRKTITLGKQGKPIYVPIKKEYLPNVYLSVLLLRPRAGKPDKDDSQRPETRVGIVKINVNTDSKKMPLQITPDKQLYKPGEKVRLQIRAQAGAEVAISVADRGVLNLISYTSYQNPIKSFYRDWPLRIRILENRNMLIKQYVFAQKGERPGGDDDGYGNGGEEGGEGGFPFTHEDGTRKNIQYTAFWKPNVTIGQSGKKTVEFRLPDNLTTFRIMAIASSKDGKYASYAKDFQVAKPMVVLTNVPRFIRAHDSVQIGGTIVNQTGIAAKFKVNLQANLLKSKKTTKVIYLKPLQSQEVTFTVRLDRKKFDIIQAANRKKPIVKGYFTVEPLKWQRFAKKNFKKSEVKDRLLFRFPVYETYDEQLAGGSGFFDTKKEMQVAFPVKGKYKPKSVLLQLRISNSILTGLDKAFRFYGSNPYFCSEQRSSAFLLAITSGELLQQLSIKPPDSKSYDFENIRQLFVDEIQDFQHSDGGFGYWKSKSGSSVPHLSVYIAHVLQVSKTLGHKINETVYRKLIEYLKDYIKRPAKGGYTYVLENLSAIALVLARAGENTESIEHLLMQRNQSLSLRAQANLLLTMLARKKPKDNKGDSSLKDLFAIILSQVELNGNEILILPKDSYSSYRRALYTDASVIAKVLEVLIRFKPQHSLIPKMVQQIISQKRAKSYYSDSHSTGALAYALKLYSDRYENSPKAHTVSVFLNSQKVMSHRFRGKKAEMHKILVPYGKLDFGKTKQNTLVLENRATKIRTYYSSLIKYSSTDHIQKAKDKGFEINQQIYDLSEGNTAQGKLVGTILERGKIYLVKTRIATLYPYSQVVITSPVPSHCEIVNPTFDTEQKGLRLIPQKKYDAEYWWEEPDERIEFRDDKMVVTRGYLREGIHEYFYLIRPTQRGRAYMPSAIAKMMYKPEVYGRSEGVDIQVK